MKTLKNFSLLTLLFIALMASTSAFAQQGQGPRTQGARLTAAERAQMQLDRYQKQLELTPEQNEKVKALIMASVEDMDKMRAAGGRPDRTAMQAETLKRAEQIKALLTPVQVEKFNKMLAEQAEGRQRMQNSQQGNQ